MTKQLLRLFLMSIFLTFSFQAAADYNECVNNGGDPQTCQLIESLDNLSSQLEMFGEDFQNFESFFEGFEGFNLDGIFDGLFDNFNWGPLQGIADTIGGPATIGIGIMSVPAIYKITSFVVEMAIKGIIYTGKKIFELITKRQRNAQWLEEFYEAKKNWDKMYATTRKLEGQLLRMIQMMEMTEILKNQSTYLSEYGFEIAINNIFAELNARRNIVNADLEQALRQGNTALASELKHAAAEIEKNYKAAADLKEVLAGGMDGIGATLERNYYQLQQAEGELQKARAHILGSADLWQKQWEKEYKIIEKKFKRARRKTDNFYRKAVRLAKSDKKETTRRLKRLERKGKITPEKLELELQLIEQTYARTLEMAKTEREQRVERAKLLYVNFAAKFGEHQSYMEWFNQITIQQINLSDTLMPVIKIYNQFNADQIDIPLVDEEDLEDNDDEISDEIPLSA